MDIYSPVLSKLISIQFTNRENRWPRNLDHVFFFYKKLGSAPSTKTFLISHENFAIIVLKVS